MALRRTGRPADRDSLSRFPRLCGVLRCPVLEEVGSYELAGWRRQRSHSDAKRGGMYPPEARPGGCRMPGPDDALQAERTRSVSDAAAPRVRIRALAIMALRSALLAVGVSVAFAASIGLPTSVAEACSTVHSGTWDGTWSAAHGSGTAVSSVTVSGTELSGTSTVYGEEYGFPIDETGTIKGVVTCFDVEFTVTFSKSVITYGGETSGHYSVGDWIENPEGPFKGEHGTWTASLLAAVVTEPASSITPTSAALQGSVNPYGWGKAECFFEYGPTPSYGKSVPCSPEPGSGESPNATSASVTGLSANTTYHFRIVDFGPPGASYGADRTFTTFGPPAVVTKAATSVGQTSATLNATVNPDGLAVTKCEFEYGETTLYSKTVACSSLPGSGTSPVAVSASITGLTANTTYHFRISATNAGGTSTGSDETFKTLPPNEEYLESKGSSSGAVKVAAPAGKVVTASLQESTSTPLGSAVIGALSVEVTGVAAKECVKVTLTLPEGSDPTYIAKRLSGGTLIREPNSPKIEGNKVLLTLCDGEYDESTSNHINPKWAEEGRIVDPVVPVEGFIEGFTPPNNIEGSFQEPEALALDPSGNEWVADSGHDRVIEFNSSHAYLRQFGSAGTAEGQFEGIRGIATNKEGDVYVSDFANDRVQEFSPTGAFIRKFGSAGTSAGQFLGPTGLAVDSSGNVWVLSSYGVIVQEFSSEGAYISGFGSLGTGSGQFAGPAGIAVSGGNLYVSEWGNQRVQEFSTSGSLIRAFDEAGSGTGKSKLPWGIAASPSTGNLYVSEVGNDRVQEFSSAGSFIAAFATPGSGPGQLSSAKGIAIGPTGTVFVADTGNNRIQEWTAGEPPTYASSFTPPSNIEGAFQEPEALALDPSGNEWVADSGHDRVIEFNSSHAYLRQFGSAGTAEGQFEGIRGIATNKEGDVYVSDFANDRVQEFSPTGAFIRKFGSAGTSAGKFLQPTGLAVDSSGNVWVLSSYGVIVQEFSSEGAYMSGFGSLGTGSGQFAGPAGIAVSGGNLYVSEWGNQRVQEFSTSGSLIRAFDEAGSGTGKSKLPWGIAASPATGNLYVSEVGNDRVQEFSSAGSFIAAFGSAGSGSGQLSDPRGVAVSSAGNVFVADTGNARAEEWLP